MSTYLKAGTPLEYDNAPDWLAAFMQYQRVILNRTATTTMTYFKDLRGFFQWLKFYQGTGRQPQNANALRTVDILDLPLDAAVSVRKNDIITYLHFCANILDNSEVTRNKKLASLQNFYNYLIENSEDIGISILENPISTIKRPKLPQSKPIYLTEEEQNSLLESISGENAVRDYAITLLCLTTGLRVSEVCNLDIKDLNLDTKTLCVRQGKGQQDRVEYLTEPCCAALNEYIITYRNSLSELKDPNALFVTRRLKTRMTTKAVYNMVTLSCQKANIQDFKRITPHKLRHTTATTLAKNGTPLLAIQHIMGHKSPITTEIYTHLDGEDIKDAVEQSPLSQLGTIPKRNYKGDSQ